jgi:predicted metallo-beta-lactamase superfamily hydrolase
VKVIPISFDSFGVRSMATFVKTEKVKIFIDPGVALGPIRYGLPPTPEEILALEINKKRIKEEAQSSNVLIVTHYHYDHHPFPGDSFLYECFNKKIVFAKDVNKDIHPSGIKRGKIFEEEVKRRGELIFCDGKNFNVEDVYIEFSRAVWHGEVNSKVGKVIMVYIEHNKDSFVFGSDAQSLADPLALSWFIEKNPKIAILDGYPTIFLGWRLSNKSFEKALQNLKKAVESTQTKTIILDHHIVREKDYKKRMEEFFRFCEENGKKVYTAAEFLGMENLFLEAWRKEIHEKKKEVNVKDYYEKLKKIQ